MSRESPVEQVRLGSAKDLLRETRPCGITYSRDSLDAVRKGIAIATTLCHDLAVHSGWWHDKDGAPIKVNATIYAAKLALVHSELSESLEGMRKGLQDSHLLHRSSVEVELADTIIRIFDLAGAMGLDVSAAIIEKLAYNQERADHKRENRFAEGGKSI